MPPLQRIAQLPPGATAPPDGDWSALRTRDLIELEPTWADAMRRAHQRATTYGVRQRVSRRHPASWVWPHLQWCVATTDQPRPRAHLG